MTVTEFEIKVLNIDTVTVHQALQANGFKELPRLDFRRHVYVLPQNENAWIRLRTDGAKTTVTYKEYVSDSIDGVQELETRVDDFGTMHELLQKTGLTSKTYQENRRTLFQKDGSAIEISIDEWPHIPAYLEIEGASMEEVTSFLKLLALEDHETTSAPTSEVYKKYSLNLDDYSALTF